MNDAEISARVRDGDVRVVEELYKTHYGALCRFARGFVRSEALAEEVVDDVFLLLWRRRTEWNPYKGVVPYLFGAVRNRALNVNRNERALQLRHTDALEQDALISPGSVDSSFADHLFEVDEVTQAVWNAIEQLPERSRTVLTLRWRHAMTPDEIAAVLGTTRAAVQMQHSRALTVLRAALSGYAGS